MPAVRPRSLEDTRRGDNPMIADRATVGEKRIGRHDARTTCHCWPRLRVARTDALRAGGLAGSTKVGDGLHLCGQVGTAGT